MPRFPQRADADAFDAAFFAYLSPESDDAPRRDGLLFISCALLFDAISPSLALPHFAYRQAHASH